jgi:hypothetical protein
MVLQPLIQPPQAPCSILELQELKSMEVLPLVFGFSRMTFTQILWLQANIVEHLMEPTQMVPFQSFAKFNLKVTYLW